jgi:hypothetical protein
MFSQFHPKATKSRSRGAFRFALRESQLLEKAASWIQPFGWLLAFRGQKPKPKAKPNTPLAFGIIENGHSWLFSAKWGLRGH